MYDYDRTRTANRKIFLSQVKVGNTISLYDDPQKYVVRKVKHNRPPARPTEEDLEREYVLELVAEGSTRPTFFNGPEDMTVTLHGVRPLPPLRFA